MQWWPIYGLRRMLTEKNIYKSPVDVPRPSSGIFNRSLFVYVIDVGSSNALNFEITALESPLYNIHHLGVFMTDSPRHADVLLILGKPAAAMLQPLQETISQMPNPFFIITIDDNVSGEYMRDYPELPNHIASLKGVPSPSQILGVLLDIAKTKRRKK